MRATAVAVAAAVAVAVCRELVGPASTPSGISSVPTSTWRVIASAYAKRRATSPGNAAESSESVSGRAASASTIAASAASRPKRATDVAWCSRSGATPRRASVASIIVEASPWARRPAQISARGSTWAGSPP